MSLPDDGEASDAFEHVLVPVDFEEDARKTSRKLAKYDPDSVTALHVTTIGSGRPDAIPVEEQRQRAESAVDAVRETFPEADTRVANAEDATDCIFETADEIDATAIVYRPLRDNRLLQILSKDVSLKLVTRADRPVITLPHHT